MAYGNMREMLKEMVGRSATLKAWPTCRPCQRTMEPETGRVASASSAVVTMRCACGETLALTVMATGAELDRIASCDEARPDR